MDNHHLSNITKLKEKNKHQVRVFMYCRIIKPPCIMLGKAPGEPIRAS